MALSQSYARASAILVDELDAGSFESSLNNVQSGTAGLARPGFQLMHRYNSDAGFVCEILLVPSKQSAGCPGLCWGDHGAKSMP
jgi:hypothetical protein